MYSTEYLFIVIRHSNDLYEDTIAKMLGFCLSILRTYEYRMDGI